MSPPKKLQLPSHPAPLPPVQERKVLAVGVSSTVIASLAVGAGILALFLFPIVEFLATAGLPVQVVATPAISQPEETEKTVVQRQRFIPKPIPPENQATASLPIHQSQLENSPQESALDSQTLSTQSTSHLEFLAAFAAEEDDRLQEIAQEEALARAEALRKQAEESERARLLAERKNRESAEKARRQQELASLNAAKKRQQEALAKEATASRQRQALASKVATTPSVISKKIPSYPISARKAGLQGTARITATVSAQGKVSSAYVSQSSGHTSLDKTALAAVKRWRFSPARNGLGQAVTHQVVVPIPFQLN
ncbi:MAG: TonB family protein [Roseibacillus sp.]